MQLNVFQNFLCVTFGLHLVGLGWLQWYKIGFKSKQPFVNVVMKLKVP